MKNIDEEVIGTLIGITITIVLVMLILIKELLSSLNQLKMLQKCGTLGHI